MVIDLQLHMQSVHITTKVVSSIPANGKVYQMQHYVINFVRDLRQVDSFLRVLRFSPPINHPAFLKLELVLGYYWNIVEGGVKRNNPKPTPILEMLFRPIGFPAPINCLGFQYFY